MPIRRSDPTARRTWSTSAPTSSQTLAISFMNEIRVARIELAAYFDSSALAVSIIMIGAPVRVNGAYSSFITVADRSSSVPMTTRSGFMKSSIAAPCLRNSGLLTTLNSADVSSAIAARTRRAVPTGTVLLSTIDGVLVEGAADLVGDAEHVLKIRRSVFALRRADGDEDDLGLLDGSTEIG